MENTEMRQEAVAAISKFWWIELVLGILWIIIALIILQFEESSLTTIGVIVGIMFVVTGIQQFLVSYIAEGWKWLWVIFGFVFLIAGVVALAYPKDTFAALADALGFLFLLVGVFWIIEALSTKDMNSMWWLGLVAGILMVILGFWAAGQFYFTKAYTLLVFAGIWALLQGVTDIIKAFQIKKLGGMTAA
ncbi:MAG: DUF308 domain-containing protein [Actinomycetota bacterium]|nr:DUF308 domain-containing protein [Actinomycetota bacterium]